MAMTPAPTDAAAAGTVIHPRPSTCAALSFAPTQTIPARSTDELANWSPGLSVAVTLAGAAFPAAAPSTIDTGIAEMCHALGSEPAIPAAAAAVIAAVASP